MSHYGWYYAHPITLYGTAQERLDEAQIATETGGQYVFNPNCESLQQAYAEEGFRVFLRAVLECKGLAFRSFDDGTIGAGVGKELTLALWAGMPVFRLPEWEIVHEVPAGILSVEVTREKIRTERAKTA